MFEDATFHSGNTVPNQIPRWLPVALAVNVFLLATMLAMPLIFPEGIPSRLLSNLIYTPPPPLAMHREARAKTIDAASRPLVVPTSVPTQPPLIQISRTDSEGPPPTIGPTSEGGRGGTEGGVPGAPTDVFRPSITPLTVKPAIAHPVRLTSTITAGLLLSKTTPDYPAIAKATGTSGTVVLAATISTTGTIEKLRVVSGSPMLTQAAIEAVQRWRYRPYLLNNQPVEVETTIQIVFTLGKN